MGKKDVFMVHNRKGGAGQQVIRVRLDGADPEDHKDDAGRYESSYIRQDFSLGEMPNYKYKKETSMDTKIVKEFFSRLFKKAKAMSGYELIGRAVVYLVGVACLVAFSYTWMVLGAVEAMRYVDGIPARVLVYLANVAGFLVVAGLAQSLRKLK